METNQIDWREVEGGFEGNTPNHDFVISPYNDDLFIIDVFQAGVDNEEAEAHLETLGAETLAEAKTLAAAYA